MTSRTFILKVATYSNICTFLLVTPSAGHFYPFSSQTHDVSDPQYIKVLNLAVHTETLSFSQWGEGRTTWWEGPAEKEEE